MEILRNRTFQRYAAKLFELIVLEDQIEVTSFGRFSDANYILFRASAAKYLKHGW